MSGWDEDGWSDGPDEWVRPVRGQHTRPEPAPQRPAESWGRESWAQDDWPEEAWSSEGGTQPHATHVSGRTQRIDDFGDEQRFATPPRYGGRPGVGRPGGPVGPRGSGLPPTLPTVPTILVALTAVIVAFVFGHSTGGGDDSSSTAATTPNVVVVTTVPPTTVAAKTYTVARGDTLASIASMNGVTTDALAAANAISDPSRIFVGQVLKIPSPASATPTPASTTTTTKK